MLIGKGFLIKFNGVGQREVVLAASILLKMLIVMFGMRGGDTMKMATALVVSVWEVGAYNFEANMEKRDRVLGMNDLSRS